MSFQFLAKQMPPRRGNKKLVYDVKSKFQTLFYAFVIFKIDIEMIELFSFA